jgi:hypothetical protein
MEGGDETEGIIKDIPWARNRFNIWKDYSNYLRI